MIFKKLRRKEKKDEEIYEDKSRQYIKQKYRETFGNDWKMTPIWYHAEHDLLLLELALKYNFDTNEYLKELNKDEVFYKKRLNILPSMKDAEIKKHVNGSQPYYDFIFWVQYRQNVLHRLKYITNKIMANLSKIEPSLVKISAIDPKQLDPSQFEPLNILFSRNDAIMHEQYTEQIIKNNINPSLKLEDEHTLLRYKGDIRLWDHDEFGKISGLTGLASGIIVRRATTHDRVSTFDNGDLQLSIDDLKDDIKRDSYDSDNSGSLDGINDIKTDDHEIKDAGLITEYPILKHMSTSAFQREHDKRRQVLDVYFKRDIKKEFEYMCFSLDLIKYGKPIAIFIIKQLTKKQNNALWDALGIVLSAVPFQMALDILKQYKDDMQLGKPEFLNKVCKSIVDDTFFPLGATLRIALFFDGLAKDDMILDKLWTEYRKSYELMAHDIVSGVESDVLLFLLLTIPMYDTSYTKSILELAVDQHRVNFLTNERILDVTTHVYNTDLGMFLYIYNICFQKHKYISKYRF